MFSFSASNQNGYKTNFAGRYGNSNDDDASIEIDRKYLQVNYTHIYVFDIDNLNIKATIMNMRVILNKTSVTYTFEKIIFQKKHFYENMSIHHQLWSKLFWCEWGQKQKR